MLLLLLRLLLLRLLWLLLRRGALLGRLLDGLLGLCHGLGGVRQAILGQLLSRALSLVPGDPSGLAVNDAFSRLGQIESPRGTWTFNINRSPQQKWYLRRLALDGRVPANLLEADLTILG